MEEHFNRPLTIEIYNITDEQDFAEVLIDTVLNNYVSHFIIRYLVPTEEDKKLLTDSQFINLKSIDKTFECGICFEEKTTGKELNCEHMFCEQCIKSWLTVHKNTCPSCRKEVVI
jgi:hypothetical protein